MVLDNIIDLEISTSSLRACDHCVRRGCFESPSNMQHLGIFERAVQEVEAENLTELDPRSGGSGRLANKTVDRKSSEAVSCVIDLVFLQHLRWVNSIVIQG